MVEEQTTFAPIGSLVPAFLFSGPCPLFLVFLTTVHCSLTTVFPARPWELVCEVWEGMAQVWSWP